jgi:hypothetical protein
MTDCSPMALPLNAPQAPYCYIPQYIRPASFNNNNNLNETSQISSSEVGLS